jgi:hypothetical protein
MSRAWIVLAVDESPYPAKTLSAPLVLAGFTILAPFWCEAIIEKSNGSAIHGNTSKPECGHEALLGGGIAQARKPSAFKQPSGMSVDNAYR